MALVACRECGSKISDAAATCPQCGVASPAGACSLLFSRPSIVNGIVGIEVFVDGQPYGSLRMRGTVTVPVAPGAHHVEVRTSQGRSKTATVNASNGETVVNVKLNALGFPKVG